MAFDLATYKRVSGRLDTEGIDFAHFGDNPLGEADLRCIRYMHDVESHTTCYLRDLLNTRAHNDPEISTFLMMWGFEELWHGEALATVLAAHEETAGHARIAPMRRRLRTYLAMSPLLWMAVSAASRHFLAIHMTFGAINEWTTQAGYSRLIARAQHPALTDLLRQIMRQEGRHIDFYVTKATEQLAASRASQRTTRRVLRLLWQPVGAGVMPAAETAHVITHLFGDDDGRAVAARIDRRIDRLPGLAGLGLVTKAVERHSPRRSGSAGLERPTEQTVRARAPIAAAS